MPTSLLPGIQPTWSSIYVFYLKIDGMGLTGGFGEQRRGSGPDCSFICLCVTPVSLGPLDEAGEKHFYRAPPRGCVCPEGFYWVETFELLCC